MLPNRDREGLTLDPKNQIHRSLTLAARNEEPRYRAATVRESVPLVFNHGPTSSMERNDNRG
jgi:hypothetical protein